MDPRLSYLLCRSIQAVRRRPFFAQVAELERTQAWPAERLRALQQERLTALLRRAAAHVPYYRDLFRSHGFDAASPRSLDELAALPVLTKERVREAGDRLVDERRRERPGSVQWTSGSTGVPLAIHGDHRSEAAALTPRVRGLRWHGIEYGAREAWVWRRFDRPLLQRVSHWLENHMVWPLHGSVDEAAARDFHARCLRFAPRLLFGNPSALSRLAYALEDAGLDGRRIGLRLVLGSGEPLLSSQAALLGRVFGAPVSAEYGCTEFGIVAFPCEHANAHWTAEHVILETHPSATPGVQRLMLTGLMNDTMPLIRYELGDEVLLGDGSCPCGRALPVVRRVVGRTSARLRLADGRSFSSAEIEPLVEQALAIPRVRQIRFVQTHVGSVTVEVATESATPVAPAEETLRSALDRLSGGRLRVQFTWMDDLLPEATGKRSIVLSRIEGAAARTQHPN